MSAPVIGFLILVAGLVLAVFWPWVLKLLLWLAAAVGPTIAMAYLLAVMARNAFRRRS
jgi:hypothetical protein